MARATQTSDWTIQELIEVLRERGKPKSVE